tara:strand:- start:1445 stop:1582 length:138 start_codon:yes stop_codon:yes gene_type:complete
MSDFNQEDLRILDSMRETKEQKSLRNLLSRKAYSDNELDEIMNFD